MKVINTFAEKKAAVETTKAFIKDEYKKCKALECGTYDLKHHIQVIFSVYYTQEEYEQILISLGFKVEHGAVNISKSSSRKVFRKCYPDNEPQLMLDNKLLKEKYNNMFNELLSRYNGTEYSTPQTDSIPGSVKDFIRANCKTTRNIARVSPSISEITRMLQKNIGIQFTDVETYKILLDMGVKCRNGRAAISIRDVERLTYNY